MEGVGLLGAEELYGEKGALGGGCYVVEELVEGDILWLI